MLSCTQCSLHTSRHLVVPGHGNPHAQIAFVAEAPGVQEDVQGEPLVGRAGQRFNRQLTIAGLCRAVSSDAGDACTTHGAESPVLSVGAVYDPEVDSPCSTHVGTAGPPEPGLALQQGRAASRVAYPVPVSGLPMLHSPVADDGSGALGSVLDTDCRPNDPDTSVEGADQLRQQPHEPDRLALREQYAGLQFRYSHPRQRILLGTQSALSCPYCTTVYQSCQPVFLDNLVHCRPPANRLRDYPDARSRCPDLWLWPALEAIRPRVVVAMGEAAGSLWFPVNTATEMSKLARACNWSRSSSNGIRQPGTYAVVGCFHPSYALRMGGDWNDVDDVIVARMKFAFELLCLLVDAKELLA